ncbi:MAG: 4Fe-4S binding protein [Nitrospirae bacterium]|nr:4Fe-4S binding protein [Nitrospirota bacterium]
MYVVAIENEKCDGCEECVNICPVEVFKLEDGKSSPHKSDECAYCLSCVEACPNKAITVTEM